MSDLNQTQRTNGGASESPNTDIQYSTTDRPLLRLLMAHHATQTNIPDITELNIERNAFTCARSILINCLVDRYPRENDHRIAKIMSAAGIGLDALSKLGQPSMTWHSAKEPAIRRLEYTVNPIKYGDASLVEIVKKCHLILSAFSDRSSSPIMPESIVYAIDRDNPQFSNAMSGTAPDLQKSLARFVFLVFSSRINERDTLTFELVRDEGLELIQDGKMKDAIGGFWLDFASQIGGWNEHRAKQFRTNRNSLTETLNPTQLELWQLFRNIYESRTDTFSGSLLYRYNEVVENINRIRRMEEKLLPFNQPRT